MSILLFLSLRRHSDEKKERHTKPIPRNDVLLVLLNTLGAAVTFWGTNYVKLDWFVLKTRLQF